jgi:hypothetical protein
MSTLVKQFREQLLDMKRVTDHFETRVTPDLAADLLTDRTFPMGSTFKYLGCFVQIDPDLDLPYRFKGTDPPPPKRKSTMSIQSNWWPPHYLNYATRSCTKCGRSESEIYMSNKPCVS